MAGKKRFMQLILEIQEKKDSEFVQETMEVCSLTDESHYLMNLSWTKKQALIAVCSLLLVIELICKFIMFKYIKGIKLKDQPINLLIIVDQVNQLFQKLKSFEQRF